MTARAVVRAPGVGLSVASAAAAACPVVDMTARLASGQCRAAVCEQAATEADAGRRPASEADVGRRVAVERRRQVWQRRLAARPLAAAPARLDALLTEQPDAARPLARASVLYAALASWAAAALASLAAVPRCEDAGSAVRRGPHSALWMVVPAAGRAPRAVQVSRRRPRPVSQRAVAARPVSPPRPARLRRRPVAVPRPQGEALRPARRFPAELPPPRWRAAPPASPS